MRRAPILLALAALALASLAAGAAAGQAPAAPVVSTAAATNVSSSGATLNGTVNPEGQATVYAFQWGPTTGYGHETPLPPGSAGSGTTFVAEAAALSGLDPGTAYHYRVIAISAGGVATGTDQTFMTSGTPPTPTTSPTVASAAATSISPTSATLNGTVNPNGQATGYYFEYGTTAAYGFQTASASAGAGIANVPATSSVTGLQPGTAYHYRLVAVSAGGTSLGSDQTLTTTAPPTVTTGTATVVGPTGATLNGTVNPNGQATTEYFQFGTTTAYGLQTTPRAAGSGTTNVAVRFSLTGLRSATTYHYRLVAVSPAGTSYGSDQTLTTTAPPTVTTGTATVVGPTGATLNGTVNPNGQATTEYFQFGTTTAYGLQTTPRAAGSGTTDVAVRSSLTALRSATTYHYRLVAVSPAGTSYGSDQTLKTTAPPPSSSQLELFGHTAFVSPQGVGGIFVGCFGQSNCTGSMQLSRSGVTLGQRGLFTVTADNGGIVHFTLSSLGQQLLRQRHHLPVEVVVSENGGNTASRVVTLVPFS